MALWNLQLNMARSRVLRYGFSIACVAIAMGLAFTFRRFHFRDIAPPFNLASPSPLGMEESGLPSWL